MFRRVLILAALVLGCGVSVSAQGFRIGDAQPIMSSLTASTPITPLQATIAVCVNPANAVPCTNKASTFTSITLATPCSAATQVVLAGTTTCVTQTDSRGNWGAWVAAGNYDITVTLQTGQSFGPYTISVGIPSGTALGAISATSVTVSGAACLNNPNGSFVVGCGTYTTTQAAITAALASSAQSNGCVSVLVPAGWSETITSSVLIGSMNRTKCIFLHISSAAHLVLNGTGGIDMFQLGSNSSIDVETSNAANAPQVFPFITVPSTANISAAITGYPKTGGIDTVIRGLSIGVDPAATITNAVIDLYNPGSLTEISNNVIGNYKNTIGIRFTADATGWGPVNLYNNFVIGAGTGTEEAVQLVSNNAATTPGISFFGGTYNHAGPGKANIEIVANSGSIWGVHTTGLYLECSSANSFGILVNNAYNVSVDHSFFGGITGCSNATAVKLTQTTPGGNATNAISIFDLLMAGTGATNSIIDSTSSSTITITDNRIIHYQILSGVGAGTADNGMTYVRAAGMGGGIIHKFVQSFGGGQEFKRLWCSNGTALTTAAITSISAGWGSPATPAITGYDPCFTFSITSGGGSPTLFPTFHFTFADGTWGAAPVCVVSRGDNANPTSAQWLILNQTATAFDVQFLGIPSPVNTYIGSIICHGKNNF